MPSGSAFTAEEQSDGTMYFGQGGGGVADDCSRGCASDGERAGELTRKGKR